MRKRIFLALLGVVLVIIGLIATLFIINNSKPLESGNITKDNLPAVSAILEKKNLSNVDSFEKWVKEYSETDFTKEESSGFNDADCRMAVMLLAGDSIKSKSLNKNYDGTYLMFDLDAIENQDSYKILKTKKNLFTTLFGEMAIPESGFKDAFPNNLDRYGINFTSKNFSIINIVFKAYEEEKAFVGHTGILINTENEDKVSSRFLFIEKIAFTEPYRITKINGEKELLDILSNRPDYKMEEGDPTPLVFLNNRLIGGLNR